MNVNPTSYADAVARITQWAGENLPHYVCVANVHMVTTGIDHDDFRETVNRADLVTPDGMPLVWMLRAQGVHTATRVRGPTLMLEVCEAAARAQIPVGFLGATPETLEALARNLRSKFPGLDVAYSFAPPFRPLSDPEDCEITGDILRSHIRILFVGLGCPKQERWMANHANELRLVQIGVGAAFDIHAGNVPEAPVWLQKLGLEWAFRLLLEPKRLWRRYAVGNSRFLAFAILQILGLRRF